MHQIQTVIGNFGLQALVRNKVAKYYVSTTSLQQSRSSSMTSTAITNNSVSKTVKHKCYILWLKCTKLNFGWAPPQTPPGELTAVPNSITGLKGAYKVPI